METLLQVTASWVLPALFFWFLFSVVVMTLVESIQSVIHLRQKGLEEALIKIMGKELTEDFYAHALANPLQKPRPAYIYHPLFAKVVLDWILPKTPLQIQENVSKENIINKSDPDDIQAINELYGKMQIEIQALAKKDKDFSRVIQAIVDQAYMRAKKLSEFLDLIQKDLEAWVSGALNQMTPVYGARLRWITLTVSLLVAIVANFDVVSITSRLWVTSKYMEVLNVVEKTGQAFDLPNLNLITMLPVGWYKKYMPVTIVDWMFKGVGIYLGAVLIAVGSQYVFNLTKKSYKPSQ